jgi:hypothetical protein
VQDDDCAYCGGEQALGTWVCVKELGADPTDHGTCGPPAEGCADLGSGASILPEPWAPASSLCSVAPDCSGLDADYDVGRLIRGLIGSNELNLGFGSVTICDAPTAYDLSRCAEIEIQDGIACGACVPCASDADCQPIAVEPLVTTLFCEDPLSLIAGAFLFDLLWGRQSGAELHFFCQPIAASYGVCTPCASPTSSCTTNG